MHLSGQLVADIGRMRTCSLCDRDFSTPYCLRRHYQQFHPFESQPKRLRMSRQVDDSYGIGSGQTGGGIHNSDDEDDEHVDSDSDISEDDDQEEMEDDHVEEADNENWVFDSIIKETKEALGEDASDKDVRKLFRHKFGDALDWYHNLRKHHIYKKIMATVKDLQEGPGDYDRMEAIRAAIKQRSFLLDRLISSPDQHEDGTDRDDASDADSGDA